MDKETKQWIVDRVMGLVGLITAVLVATQALAADDKHLQPANETWKSERGSCQAAHPPPAEHAIAALGAAAASTQSVLLARSIDDDKD